MKRTPTGYVTSTGDTEKLTVNELPPYSDAERFKDPVIPNKDIRNKPVHRHKVTSLNEAREFFIHKSSGGVMCDDGDKLSVVYCYKDAEFFFRPHHHSLNINVPCPSHSNDYTHTAPSKYGGSFVGANNVFIDGEYVVNDPKTRKLITNLLDMLEVTYEEVGYAVADYSHLPRGSSPMSASSVPAKAEYKIVIKPLGS